MDKSKPACSFHISVPVIIPVPKEQSSGKLL